MRSLTVHFTGGTEVAIDVDQEPKDVYEALLGPEPWLVITDVSGEEHYLAKAQIAYLTFGTKKGIGFA